MIDLKYTTTNMSVLEYRIAEKEAGYSIPGDSCKLDANINLHFNSDAEELIFHYTAKYIDKRSDEELMVFRTKMVFRIFDFKKALSLRAGEVTVSESFLANFVTIVTGAARGMLAMLNKGSYLNDSYLPVNNNQEILAALKNQLFKK